jgi:hypothetical protein
LNRELYWRWLTAHGSRFKVIKDRAGGVMKLCNSIGAA